MISNTESEVRNAEMGMRGRMRKTTILLSFMIIMLLTGVCAVFAQENGRTEMDASALTAGQPFRFTITVNSD